MKKEIILTYQRACECQSCVIRDDKRCRRVDLDRGDTRDGKYFQLELRSAAFCDITTAHLGVLIVLELRRGEEKRSHRFVRDVVFPHEDFDAIGISERDTFIVV